MGFNYDNGSTNANYYYGIDNFGNINYIYDASGNIVVTYRYDAWGKPISTTGTAASTVGAANPYRYKSYYYDTETGLYYLQSRYYDAGVGRFVNADEAMYLGMSGGTYAYNLYAYCENDPVNNSDPNGCLVWPGEIHNFVQGFVQTYLLLRYALWVISEYSIRYGFLKYKRADLYAESTGEVWEVKPNKPKYYISGPIQLNDYIVHIRGAKHGRNIGVLTTYYVSKVGLFQVVIYSNTSNGMIYYDYDYAWKATIIIAAAIAGAIFVSSGAGAPVGGAILKGAFAFI